MEFKSLSKGSKMDLTKGNPGLSVVNLALGWDEGDNLDPDACCVVIHNSKPVTHPDDVLWYNSNKAVDDKGNYIADMAAPKNEDGSTPYKWADATKPYPFIMGGALVSSGDNRDGHGATLTDKETIVIDLAKLGADVSHLVPVITIYEAGARKQTFGSMANAYARISAPAISSFQTAKSDLTEDATSDTAFIPGFFYKASNGTDWKYDACMKGVNGDTKGADGKPIGEVNILTIAANLTAILGIKAPEAATA